MLMRRILQRARDRVDDLGLVARLPVCGETEAVHDINYVDDAPAYTWGPDAHAAIANVKTITAELCCWEVRVPGGFAVQRAKSVHEQVCVADNVMLTVEYGAGSLLLPMGDAYKHLGGIAASSGS